MAKFSETRTFGVEIEVTTSLRYHALETAINAEFQARGINQTCNYMGYSHETMRQWKIVPDGSVRGWEVVSPPMSGFNGKAEIEAVCKALQSIEVSVDRSTGLHVHHDAADLTGRQIGAVVTTYAANQSVINYMVSPSRRGNGYGASLNYNVVTNNGRDKFGTVFNHNSRIDAERKILSRLGRYGSTRYNAVNLVALRDHGTIEFRQHQGSIDATKIWNWVVFTQSMMEASKEISRMPKAINIDKDYPRGVFNQMRWVTGVAPWANNGDKEGSKVYMDTYKYYARRFKDFAQHDNLNPMSLRNESDWNSINNYGWSNSNTGEQA